MPDRALPLDDTLNVGFADRGESKNKNARQGITTDVSTSSRASSSTSSPKTKMPDRALPRNVESERKAHQLGVQKQKCPTGHYHVDPKGETDCSIESKNKNARQGITTGKRGSSGRATGRGPKTKMPDRALPPVRHLALSICGRCKSKNKNARQGITTTRKNTAGKGHRATRPKTKMPDRALPLRAPSQNRRSGQWVQKQKCPTGHYHPS